jgi:hypothetical protein
VGRKRTHADVALTESLEFDHLINSQLSSVDQIVIVYVFSAKEKEKTIKEVDMVYRELNRYRSMPCVQVSMKKCGEMFTCMFHLYPFP